MPLFRKDLGIPSLIVHLYRFFSKIPDPRSLKYSDIPIVDHLMSGLAVFGLKCPSLLDTKNDCERNACKRFLENFRREHPHLKVILVEDGLSSTAPNIRTIEEFCLKYILVAKPGDHQFLFEQLELSEHTQYYEEKTDDGFYHQFRFVNGVSLNKSNQDVK